MKHINELRSYLDDMHKYYEDSAQDMEWLKAIDWALSLLAPERADGHAKVLIEWATYSCSDSPIDSFRAGAAALIENIRLHKRITELESHCYKWVEEANKRGNERDNAYALVQENAKLHERIAELESSLHAKENDGER